MLKGKKGNQTATPLAWDNLLPRWMRAAFWKRERMAQERCIKAEAQDAWWRRGIDRRPTTNEAGDTVWPDSD